MIRQSEMILNADGSIYHLKARPGQLAEKIITVGDQERVSLFEQHFDRIDYRIENREFRILTGEARGQMLSVVSTGIGTDNIDIALNEIDALFNVDLESRMVKEHKSKLKFFRIGTSGAIRPEVPIDSFIMSRYAVGFDGLLHFYKSDNYREKELENRLLACEPIKDIYAISASPRLIDEFKPLCAEGITLTAPGFYAPQSRKIRLDYSFDIVQTMLPLRYKELKCTNLEMETAGIYGLAAMLGHEAISLNAILANRYTGEFSSQPQETVNRLIEQSLDIICRI